MRLCKLAGADNCDEETKWGYEYCLFHKPEKSEEEEREFYEKLLRRLNPKREIREVAPGEEEEIFVFEDGVDCRGYVFPPIPRGLGFSFEGAVFKRRAIFDWARFHYRVYFERCIFKDIATFRNTTFEAAEFHEAIFEKLADFTGATFKYADFADATFKGGVDFSKATFKEAHFERATFKSTGFPPEVKLYGFPIKGEVRFTRTKFEGIASFSWAKFERNALFNEVTFNENAKFDNSKFENVKFVGSTFKKDALFNEATFNGSADFSNGKFYGKLNLSRIEFRKGIEIVRGSYFKLLESEAEACRVQRISYEREERREEAERIFVRERRVLRKARVEKAKLSIKEVEKELSIPHKPQELIKNIIKAKEALNSPSQVRSKLKAVLRLIKAVSSISKAGCISLVEYLIADLTCEYGTNWRRPIALWIFVVCVLCPTLYLIPGLFSGVLKADSLLYHYLNCLYFSIAHVTSLGYVGPQTNGSFTRAVAAAEAIFGAFIWAVFLLVFARKYMR
jgi:uncharacterized protein YjbI with pentapeptide repeats